MLVEEPISIMGMDEVLIYNQDIPWAREVAYAQLVSDAVAKITNTNDFSVSPAKSMSLGTCAIQKTVGQTADISINTQGGTAPYSFTVTKKVGDGIPVTLGTYNNVGENATTILSYDLTDSDIGSVLFSIQGQDSCTSGAKPISDSCAVNVVAEVTTVTSSSWGNLKPVAIILAFPAALIGMSLL